MNSGSIYTIEKNEFSISTDKSLLDVNAIHSFLSQHSYWSPNIPLRLVERSIENSICFGVYDNKKQIGFARVVTDKATFAYLADVFIIDDYRGKGLSKWLIATIIDHPEINEVRGILLRTKDAHGLYEQFGWQLVGEESIKRYMVKPIMPNYTSGK